MTDDSSAVQDGEQSSVYDSVFGNIDALVYRCQNDENYTMNFLNGQVSNICGYARSDLLENATVSWVSITAPEDSDRITATVDAALEAKEGWDIDYRIIAKDGSKRWVRERGCGIFENQELKYLQGLIVGADAEVALREKSQKDAKVASQEAANVVSLTEQIATSLSKLSMLAVNARIEAARSGSAGLGFAVVAEEMSALAEENAVWTKSLTDQVNKRNTNENSRTGASLNLH